MKEPFCYFKTSPEIILLAVMMYARYPLSLRQVEVILHERGIDGNIVTLTSWKRIRRWISLLRRKRSPISAIVSRHISFSKPCGCYARFTLSYRAVEDLLAGRSLDISYETVRRWFLKFGAPIAQNLRSSRPSPNDIELLDEMVIIIRGKRHFLWRAVDSEGETLDFLVQPRRNAKATLELMKKLLKKQGFAPSRIVTDKLKSYHKAFQTLGLNAEHIDNKR